MTDAEALDRAVEVTGHARYRDLVATRPEYWPVVRTIAGAEPTRVKRPSAGTLLRSPSPREVRAALSIVGRCQWRARPACGCQADHCSIRGRLVSGQECLDCVTRYGDA